MAGGEGGGAGGRRRAAKEIAPTSNTPTPSRDRSKSEGEKDIPGGVPRAAGGRRRKFDKDRGKYIVGMVLCM